MNRILLTSFVLGLALAGCSKQESPTPAAAGSASAAASAPVVRAPAPPAPPGTAAPEIPPEVLAKIRADLERNPPRPASAPASPAPASAGKR